MPLALNRQSPEPISAVNLPHLSAQHATGFQRGRRRNMRRSVDWVLTINCGDLYVGAYRSAPRLQSQNFFSTTNGLEDTLERGCGSDVAE